MVEWNPVTPSGFLIELDSAGDFVSFIEEPVGNVLTFADVLAQHQAASVPAANEPGKPLVLLTPVSVTNDVAPQTLTDLSIQLAPNTHYEFELRFTRYSSQVPLNVGFVVPGDDPVDVTADAVMEWNGVVADGASLDEDDVFQYSEIGDPIAGQSITGTITTKSLGGQFIPQFGQSVADATASEVVAAYLKVEESGN